MNVNLNIVFSSININIVKPNDEAEHLVFALVLVCCLLAYTLNKKNKIDAQW